ncbi:hypothetical protein [uncultured Enterovirga sp.]|uniref:hypothetical protein n=1 Tax=uncultured Enterovirga sp. TaxID=2026352 RepID=UPI0035CB2EE7
MDLSIRADIESNDIIARIMAEMEEVIGLIHRPGGQEPSSPLPPVQADAAATQAGSPSTEPDSI